MTTRQQIAAYICEYIDNLDRTPARGDEGGAFAFVGERLGRSLTAEEIRHFNEIWAEEIA